MNAAIAIGIILAFLVLNAIVIKIFVREQGSLEEYAVGGRSFPWFLSMFGFLGSWYVGSMYTGMFGDAANIGVFAQYGGVYSIGSLVVMYILVRPVWTFGKIYNLQTNADLVELRYNSKFFGTLIAITTFLFWSPWLVVEIKTIGYIVSAATYGAVPFNVGMIIVSLFVILYSWYGGARAGVIGDLVQGLFFTVVGSITMLYLAYQAYGGYLPMFEKLSELSPELMVINEQVGYGGWSSAIIAGVIGGMMMPGIFIRLYMSKNVKEAKKIVLFTPLIGALFSLLVIWLGLGGSLLDGFPKDAQTGAFWIADKFGGPVAVGLMGIFALAACMSTISSATMTAAIMIGKNMLGLFQVDEAKIFRYSRALTIVVGVIATLAATMEITRLVSVILYLYDCIVQVGVPIILGLYWKRGNVYGAIAGTVAGMAVVLLRSPFPELVSWAGGWSAGIIGLVLNLILYVGISLLTPKHHHVDELFAQLKNYEKSKKKETADPMPLAR